MPLPEPARIVAVRHGETPWNVDGRMQGHTDIALNENGRWQAAQAARALADEPLAAIYSSDLQRAHVTAQALSAVHGLPVRLERGLRERCFGSFEGHRFADLELHWPEDAARWRGRDPAWGAPGGETLTAFYARCVGTLERLAAQHRGEQIAVVAHGGVLDCFYRAAVGVALDAPRTWQLGNASINRLMWHDQGLALVGWNDDRHLAQASRDEAGAA